MIELVFSASTLFYFFLISFFFIGILISKKQKPHATGWKPRVSVLVPARDEAATISGTLESLRHQSYPADKLEVFVIDDHSSDNTAEVVSTFVEEHRLENFKLLVHRTDGKEPTFKKAAIAFALQYAWGEIIMTTDADCILKPQWVESMVKQYDEETGMVAGLVAFDGALEEGKKGWGTIFGRLQSLEFAGIVFAGVGAVGLGRPLICNGSNLSYRRQAFEDVDGFSGHDHLPSGDDDLLMQSIHKKTKWKIKYNLEKSAINYSHPLKSVPGFLKQRSRWASKGVHYPGIWISTMLFLIYLFYAGLFFLTPLTIAGLFPVSFLAGGFILKLIPEFLVITQALNILERKNLFPYVLLAEFFQIPYVVIVGFRGFFNLFKWKNG
jgi:cellulose synthase/poly-beta-1,6-N-acetylglucosamine synthase-like glycosyltransferase